MFDIGKKLKYVALFGVVFIFLLGIFFGYIIGQTSAFMFLGSMLGDSTINFEINESEMVDRMYEIAEEESPYLLAYQNELNQKVREK